MWQLKCSLSPGFNVTMPEIAPSAVFAGSSIGFFTTLS
jgi:hypothetical protein